MTTMAIATLVGDFVSSERKQNQDHCTVYCIYLNDRSIHSIVIIIEVFRTNQVGVVYHLLMAHYGSLLAFVGILPHYH